MSCFFRLSASFSLLEQFRKRFAGVAAGATEAVAPFSLRSVLLRSASTNAMGAFVLSTVSFQAVKHLNYREFASLRRR